MTVQPPKGATTALSAVVRRAHDAATRLNHAVLFLMFEARKGSPNSERRWLVGYEAETLLSKALSDAEALVPLLNADAGDEAEHTAKRLYDALRARRLAAKLDQVEGRTPEEAEAFKAKARKLRAV